MRKKKYFSRGVIFVVCAVMAVIFLLPTLLTGLIPGSTVVVTESRVPSGYVLPLGDNRDNSHDGRYFGPVPEGTINGRVVGRFWPLNRISSLADNR